MGNILSRDSLSSIGCVFLFPVGWIPKRGRTSCSHGGPGARAGFFLLTLRLHFFVLLRDSLASIAWAVNTPSVLVMMDWREEGKEGKRGRGVEEGPGGHKRKQAGDVESRLLLYSHGRVMDVEERTGQSCHGKPAGQSGARKPTASLCTSTYGCEVILAMSHGQTVQINRSPQSVE